MTGISIFLKLIQFIAFSAILTTAFTCKAKSSLGLLSEPIVIASKSLKYDVAIRVYQPAKSTELLDIPVLYVTDGQWFINPGNIVSILDEEIKQQRIEPVVVVFVDSRDPHNLKKNRRNQEFMCNGKYAEFFINELLPYSQQHFNVSKQREDNVITGISFGGLNAGCFNLMANGYFGGIAMLSPANSKMLRELRKMYRENKPKNAKIFLSFGTLNDNLLEGRRLKETLEHLGYDLHYHEVDAGHNWQNWTPLLDDMLQTFFKPIAVAK